MKSLRIALVGPVAGMLLAFGAQAQVNIPNPMSPGNSPDSAVRVIATNDFMVERFIKRWLRAHYADWHADPHEYMNIGMEKYAVVYITSAGNPGRRVYFRVQSRPGDPDDSDSRDGSFPF
jgi:hypothetical protein